MVFTQKKLRPFFVLATILLGLFLFNQTAKAEYYLQGDTVQSSETISNDVFLNGEEIVVAGTVEGDVFAVGNNITIDGTVEGSLFTIGQNITVNGAVDGSVYGAGVTFTLGENAKIGRSLYWVGVHLGLKKGSEIGWDLNGFMMSARLIGSVGRDIKASIGLLDLIQFFLNTTDDEFEGVLAPETEVVENAEIETAVVDKSDISATKIPESRNATQTAQQEEAEQTQNELQDQLMRILTLYVSLLIVGAILAWLFPKQLDAWAFQVRDRPVHATGHGFIGYFMGFISTFFLIALVVAIGLGLFKLNLNELALLSWGIGFSTIGLGFSLFLALVAFISKVIVSYVAGTMVLEKIIPAATNRRAFPIILGLLLFVLLRAIPYFGWASNVIITWMGMGAVWMAYQANKTGGNTAVSNPNPEPDEAAQIPTAETSNEAEEMEKAIAEAS